MLLAWRVEGIEAHVQANAADGAGLLRSYGRQNPADGGLVSGRGTGIEDGGAGVNVHFDIFAFADGGTDINLAVDGLADEDLGVIALRDKSNETFMRV